MFASVALNASVEFLIVIFLTYLLSFIAAWAVGQIGILKFMFNGEPFRAQPPAAKQSESKIAVGTR